MSQQKCRIAVFFFMTVLLDLVISIYLTIRADQSIDHTKMPNFTLSARDTYPNFTLPLDAKPEFYVSITEYLGVEEVGSWWTNHTYNFFSCQLDFIVICLLRTTIVTLTFLAVACLRNSSSFANNLNSLRTLFICIFLSLLSYGPVKLLALTETYDDLSTLPWFLALLILNSIFSVLSGVVWCCVVRAYNDESRRPAATVSLLSARPGNVQTNVEEAEPLVHEQWPRDDATSTGKHLINSADNDNAKFEPDTASTPSTRSNQGGEQILSRRRDISEFDNVSTSDRSFGLNLGMQVPQDRTDSLVHCPKQAETLDVSQSTSLMLRLLKYCRKEWLWYTFGFLFLFCYSGARIFIPWYTGRVISDIIVHRSHERLSNSIFNMIILSIFSAIFSGLRAGCFMYAIAKVNAKIRGELFSSLVRQEIGFFDVTKTGEITSRLTSDCQVMSDTVASNVNLFLRSSIMFVGSLVMMANLSWRMTLMIFIVMPLIVIISKVYGAYYEKLASRGQDALAKTNEVAEEVLGSMRTVRSFANELGESMRYNFRLLETLRIGRKKAIAYTGFTWINEWIDLIVLAAVLWYGGHLVLTGRLLAENLLSYLLYQLQLAETLINMGSVYTGLMEAVGASRRVFQLIDRQPKITNDGAVVKQSVNGQIQFKNVKFAYPSRPTSLVLQNVSFTVNPGEICALVGPSGGGKSSCIALLEHFYEPLSGQILLDGTPVFTYEHMFYHRIVALVGQDPVLYARSVRENIAYSLDQEQLALEEVIQAAKLANAHQFICSLSKGYDTDVGEKGLQLSGGQKQRVAIARAIVRKPKVLLLDEATSALDAESEHLVQKALYENLAGYTVLLIAHRLSTVRRAHRIIVIDKGRVLQQGSHEELMQQDGLYKNLVHRQLLGDHDTKGNNII